jgi:hypothetical protein
MLIHKQNVIYTQTLRYVTKIGKIIKILYNQMEYAVY